MNALKQPPIPNPTVSTPSGSNPSGSGSGRRVVSIQHRKRARQTKHRSHSAVAAETLVKIVTNGILSTVALAALVNLFPYYWSQQAQLQSVQTEVKQAEAQVKQLRNNLSRSFDPAQAQNVMSEQSAMLAPNQRRVILTNQGESGQ